jgi:hypothetical protein
LSLAHLRPDSAGRLVHRLEHDDNNSLKAFFRKQLPPCEKIAAPKFSNFTNISDRAVNGNEDAKTSLPLCCPRQLKPIYATELWRCD